MNHIEFDNNLVSKKSDPQDPLDSRTPKNLSV